MRSQVMMPNRARRALVFAMVLAALLTACGSQAAPTAGRPSTEGPKRLKVATTVAPITSIVANIAGDRADVVGVIPEGSDSHTFEPQPSVAELLSTADVVFVNGLKLEDPTKELAEANLKQGAEIVEVGTQSIPESEYIYDFSFPKSEGKPNPHLWTDPKYAKSYARIAAETLAKRDPTNASYYQGNYQKFAGVVDELDKAMRTSFGTIPAGNRKLLTYHDAYAYFGKDYDWQIIGAIQVSSFEDPTPKEVAALIEQVRAEHVPAIFGSEVFPSPVLQQIGKETGVRYVDTLRDDDLPGAPGEADHSWLGLMRSDYITMTESLGGNASALKAVEVRDVAPDKAEYPQ